MTNAVSIAQGGSNNVTMRNRIINGAMVIDQRNAGAAVTTDSAFPVDRFTTYEDTDGAYSAQRDTTAPTGFVNSLKWTTTTADGSLSATQYAGIYQGIEGFNVADLGWGSANAKTVTLSFWVRSSLTGTFGGSFRNNANNRSYPFTYSISVADTWEQKTVTVSGDTSGTWTTDNTAGIKLFFSLGVGTTYSGTAGAWAGSNFLSATGAVSVIGTLNATFYITGVQLEAGTTATPFEQRLYGTELALCQRYYYKHTNNTISDPIANACYYNATTMFGLLQFPVTMRTTPTIVQVTGTNYYRFYCNNGPDYFNNFGLEASSPTAYVFYNGTEMSGTAGQGGWVEMNNASGLLAFTAEL